MEPFLLQQIKDRINFLKKNMDRLIIDADTHISSIEELSKEDRNRYQNELNYYHGKPISAEDLIREMNLSGVDMCLIWQNPSVTHYGNDKEKNFKALYAANRYIYQSAVNYPEKFIPAGWTDPKALGIELALNLIEKCINEFGFLIIKMNPAQNEYLIDSDDVVAATNKIIEMGAIPAFHFGGDTPFTPAEGLERLAVMHPDNPFIGIHMGGGGSSYTEGEIHYHKARKLGLRRSNIYFVESAKRDNHIECDLITYQLAGKPFSEHLFCGSDAPYGRQSWNFGGYKMMFESLINCSDHKDKRLQQNPGLFSKEVAQKYLGGNIAKLVLDGYRKMIKDIND